MQQASRVTLVCGMLILLLSISNWFLANDITPELQRAEVLSGLAGVGLMLIGLLWSEITPKKSKKVQLVGQQGLIIDKNLPVNLKKELTWGTQLILTATPAASLLIWWNDQIILRRGILSNNEFEPGPICKRARESGKIISLVKTKLYPGRVEFDSICCDLPALMVIPLVDKGWLIIGGWSERCFSRSDEIWIEGWSTRLVEAFGEINSLDLEE